MPRYKATWSRFDNILSAEKLYADHTIQAEEILLNLLAVKGWSIKKLERVALGKFACYRNDDEQIQGYWEVKLDV